MKRGAVLVSALLLLLAAWWLLRELSASEATAALRVAAPSGRLLPAAESREPMPLVVSEPIVPATAPEAPATLAPPAGRQTQDGFLGLDEDGQHVSGRVVDEHDRPVAGAAVQLVVDDWGVEGQYFEMEQDFALTDDGGRFRLRKDDYQEADALRLVVRADGYPPWFGRVEPLADGGVVKLGSRAYLCLFVRFEDGEPVADAVVEYENPGRDRELGDEDAMLTITSVGRTGPDGNLMLPIFHSRRQLSLLIQHDLYFGRHDVPFDAWRAGGRDFEWTLTVPRGSACELQLLGWPGEWAGKDSWVSLRLLPYRGVVGGALELAQYLDWDPLTQPRYAGIVNGRAHLTRLAAPAYRVELCNGTESGTEVLADPWVPTPGLTTWTHATPPVPAEWYEPLVVTVAIADDATLWSGIEWKLQAHDAYGHFEERRLEVPGEAVRFSTRFEGDVTLRVAELGDFGLRTGVPSQGEYHWELAADDVRHVTGGLRVDLGGIMPPPAEGRCVVATPGNKDVRGFDGFETHGLPVGRWRVSVHASGVDETPQAVEIQPGRTVVVNARPAPPPTMGLLRGRLRVRGDDTALRLVQVDIESRATNGSGADTVGARSFAVRLAAGHYRGHVTLGRADIPVAFADEWPDPGMIRREALDELPLTGTFEADVHAGQTTDVEVDVDATVLQPPAAPH